MKVLVWVIRGFCTKIKSETRSQSGTRIVSLGFKRDLRKTLKVLRWSVRAINFWGEEIAKAKRRGTFVFTLRSKSRRKDGESGKCFVIYRTQVLTLLNFPKPVFDQLVFELPCLMGFRADEICTWRVEYIDFRRMNTLVFDSKKKRLFTVPLNTHVAMLAERLLDGRSEGYVLLSRSRRNPNQRITPASVWHIWKKYARLAGLPNADEFSPLTGRRFFAAEWHYRLRLPLVTLQMILRHNHYETTMKYVRNLVFYEDLKRDYDRFQSAVAQSLKEMNQTWKEKTRLYESAFKL